LRLFARINRRWEFHDVQLSRTVSYAYQALAIDERRRPFKPTVWTQSPTAPEEQVLEQVWFAGAHSDVGGGCEDPSLSDIALCWMVKKAMETGLAFLPGHFLRVPPPPPDGSFPTPDDRAEALLRERSRRARAETVNPDPDARCHPSMTLLYKIFGSAAREIPYIDRTVLSEELRGRSEEQILALSAQTVATSAAERSETAAGCHDSPRLREYLDSGGKTTGVPTIAGSRQDEPVVP
jgi:hypothetical protein